MPERTRPGVNPAGVNRWFLTVRRAVLFCLLWILLGGGTPASWLVGGPAVFAATWICLQIWHGPALSLTALIRFLPWFGRQSIAGALDVAVRAFHPVMPLWPGTVEHELRLPEGASRVALANVISMLPGTLSADLEGSRLVVHALDTRQDLHRMIADLEPRIAAVFGVRPETTP